MIITNSPDITKLQVLVKWDISGTLPQILLVNESEGSNLAGCVWAFTAASPSLTPIVTGDISTPDITGNWSTNTISAAWPRPFNQIEWSGAPYTFFVTVKDSIGNVYVNEVQNAFICRPFGNTQAAKNTYGIATSDVKVQCQQGATFFQDTTYHTYSGQDGLQVSSVLRVIYPIDETLTIPDPFIGAAYSTALVPISYSSSNYQFVQTSVYDYEVGENSIIRIKYQTIQTFSVYCNLDLLPLVCEINKLIDTVESGNCESVVEAQRKMNLIVSKFTLVMIGIQQPLTGVDVPLLIEEIIAIGGFDCNCCTAATGIIPVTSSTIDGYNFIVNKLGGDINGSFTTNGNNITLNLGDISYVVAIGNQSPQDISAFSFTSQLSGGGFSKTYYLNIDGTQLATDILNIISSNTGLVNLFNSIVTANQGNFELVVNMDCIGTNSDACDYTFTLTGISNAPSNSQIAIIQSSIPANQRTPNFAFNLSTLPSLQAYLNTLGIGTFTVTNPSGTTVLIETNTNNFGLTGMVYFSAGVAAKKLALFTANCTGFIARSANQVVQDIIDYLCGLTDAQIVTSQDYIICSINPATNQKEILTVPAGTAENILISAILDKNCDTVDYVNALKGVNCTSMQSLFKTSSYLLQNTDLIYGTKGGLCAGINPVEAATRMLQLGVYNADFMSAFCAAVSLCSSGFACEPYTVFQVAVVDASPSYNNMNIVVTFSHPSAVKNTIRYARIDNTSTPVYTTIPNVLPGASPYTIAGLSDGDYFVGITPIYADGRSCSEVSATTGACAGITAFSAIFDESGNIIVSYSAINTLPTIKVVINYPNGGTSSTLHTNNGTDITITPPVGVTGDYYITLVPVCNATTGFEGQPTAPVILTITPSNNSTFTNNTSNVLAPVSLMATEFGTGNNVTPFNVASVAVSGIVSFFIADGMYSTILLTAPTGLMGEAYLVTGTGTYIGVALAPEVGGTHQMIFSNVNISGGATISTNDSSPA